MTPPLTSASEGIKRWENPHSAIQRSNNSNNMGSDRMFGLDLHSLDSNALPPTTTDGDRDELYKWFQSDPGTDGTVHIRILCVQIDSPKKRENSETFFDIPLEKDIVEHAIWNPEVYLNFTKSAAGGAAALLDYPVSLLLNIKPVLSET
jgi:hypothetical protein